jgi:hypothetical protein
MIPAADMSRWARIDRKRWRHLAKFLRRYDDEFPGLPELIKPQSKHELNAHNAFARANFRRSLAAKLFDFLGAIGPRFIADRDVYFLTIIDGAMVAYPGEEDLFLRAAGAVPMHEVRTRYLELLRGLDYVGMIEPALYISTKKLFGVPRLVNYHVHCLVWGISREDLRRFCRAINAEVSTLVPHAVAAKFKLVRAPDLRKVLCYLSKMPAWQTQLWVKEETGRHHQASRRLNGINAVRVLGEMAEYDLADLAIGGGRGKRMVTAALRQAKSNGAL